MRCGMSLLEMSISGAVLIGVIAVLRALTLHRLPKRAFLVLWSVAVLRLLLPVSIPAVFSVYTWISSLPKAGASPVTVSRETSGVPLRQIVQSAADVASNAATATNTVSVWWLVWAIGALLLGALFAAAYFRCRLEFRTGLPVEREFAKQWCEHHPLRRRISIRQSDRISAPLTYGIFRPVILLPKHTDWTAEAELEYVLLHEYIHIRRFDAARKIVLTIALCVHWFNPMAWLLYVLYNRDMEHYCDEQVVRQFQGDARATYARTLIHMEETKSGPRPLYSGFSKTAMEERIKAIMKFKKVTFGAALAAVLLVAGITTVFATSAAVEEGPQSPAAYAEAQMQESAAMDAPEEAELLREYASFGVTEEKGDLYYHGELIRWFLDGYEQDENVISRYESYNSKGVVDVHTVRKDKKNPDGSTELFGPITDIVPYSQEEFDRREFAFVSKEEAVVEESSIDESDTVFETAVEMTTDGDAAELFEGTQEDTVAEAGEQTETVGGTAFEERFRTYEPFGVAYVEAAKGSGRGNVSYKGKPVHTFVDNGPGGVFTFQSADGGDIDVKTVYDKNGNLAGVKEISAEEREELVLNAEVQQEIADTWEETLAPYKPFGLHYQFDPSENRGDGGIKMSWNGKEVRGIMDEVTEIWISEHTGRSAYGEDAVELYAVYQNGKLSGLREATDAEMKAWNDLRDQASLWQDDEEISEG